MGVVLSLEGDKPARARRRRGQHGRTTEDKACLDALAAFLRADAVSAGRSLSRVSRAGLAARLLPAARALTQAASLVLAEPPDGGHSVEFDLAISPACLLAMCTGPAAANPGMTSPCSSPECQHSCHSGPRTQTYSAGIAGSPGLPGPA